MARFTLPRDLYHGKGALEALKTFEGKRAIICVGGGSMKRFGFLDKAEAYLKEAGMESEEVDCLFLAGAFGNYIDIDHALSIGLLPPVPREKIVSVGNGAGDGVQTLLMDQSYREKLKIISDHCIHVELANHPLFMEEYIKNMNFDFA